VFSDLQMAFPLRPSETNLRPAKFSTPTRKRLSPGASLLVVNAVTSGGPGGARPAVIDTGE
jgi:hypothetical protein